MNKPQLNNAQQARPQLSYLTAGGCGSLAAKQNH